MIFSVLAGFVAGCLSYFFSLLLIPIGKRFRLLDNPHVSNRKVHARPIVMVGGLAIWASITLLLLAIAFFWPDALPQLGHIKWSALGAATLIIFIVGTLDDRFLLSPRIQIIGPICAALIVTFAGIVVGKITNPAGGIFDISQIPFIPQILTFVWLLGMMYGTKLLDGLDGLSTGLSGIGAIMIFALTQTQQYFEPRVGLVALIFAGACFGFLIINFNPARAFLGEGGSLFVGFVLGILAIMSGSKIATTLLVMGLPVLDVVRLMIVRTARGQSIAHGDRGHLHHLLLANGFSHRGAVLFYYAVAFIFGLTALVLQSSGKVIMLIILVIAGLVGAHFLQQRLKNVMEI
ncbi:MAG: MraY family glycosyltransferase [Candidatus Magasanikbacteria bacterium]|nr:MraY family glycosyltransferase [Candidatus Magasanikbacteria bacterium]